MSSPMVETVREIPLIVEKECPMDSDDTGFPFDDDNQSDSPFRSRLDDLAARHPEFAQQLNFGSFPFRARRTTPDPFSQRFTTSPDRSFGFERFGFPFNDEPKQNEKEESQQQNQQRPYYQRYPQYYPQNDNTEGETSTTQTQNTGEVNQNERKEPEQRGRKKQNVQQSNTVDLGQAQEQFVDDRNQRSMSAPPPNSRPARYVSSVNIPVNQGQPKETTQNAASAAPSQPQERVIPIHVEGRDEPIVPRHVPPPTRSQHPPNTEKYFTQRTPNFPEYFQRDQHDWFPKGFKQQQQHQQNFNQRGRSPQPQPKPEHTQQEKPSKVEAEPSPPPQQQQPSKPDPIDQIKLIQKDVSELMGQVDQFTGKPRDKQYLYLDEMLTRNLIKLDNIDTQGQENIRQARKEAIKCIEKCISILESKALSNVEEKKMDVEESNQEKEKPMEIEEKQQESDSMDVEAEAPKTEEVIEAESKEEKVLNNKTEQSNVEENKSSEDKVESEAKVENDKETKVDDDKEKKTKKK